MPSMFLELVDKKVYLVIGNLREYVGASDDSDEILEARAELFFTREFKAHLDFLRKRNMKI